jgi:hypothetical protein
MKSIEQLVKLSQNPFYKMSEEEVKTLETVEQDTPKVSSKSVDSKKKVSQTTLGNATVKETGKLSKHASDPVSE